MVRKYPGEVVIWAGGPLTNIALALRLDPEVAALAKGLVLMGSGMYANQVALTALTGAANLTGGLIPRRSGS